MDTQMSDLDLIINNDKALGQIVTRLDTWWSSLNVFFNEYEEYANCYRLIDVRRNQPNVAKRTRVGDTVRATEALTTSIYRMLTSQDPNYDLVNMNGTQTAQELYNAHLLLRWQDMVLRWKRNLLRAVRGCTLFGTQFVETPWVREFRNGQLLYEGLGFIPRSLLQCAFDPHVLNIEDTKWIAFIDYMSEDQLLDLAESDPENWNPEQVQKAINEFKGAGFSTLAQNIQARRMKAGYIDGPDFEVVTYYGYLRDIPREDKRMWCIRVVNEKVPVSAFGNPSPTGKMPFKVAKFIDFELEPFGRGVGQLGRTAQPLLDENRSDYMGITKMALMNMWIKQKTAGVRNADLRIRPLGIIEVEDINGLKPHTPDLRAVEVGLKIEEMLRAEHQGNTGATPNLQATVTDVSATESGIAQNEAIRRIAVIAEFIGEPFIAEYQQEKHDYNKEWFEPSLYLAVTNREKPVQVNRMNIARDIGTFMKIVTDKDFRPQRLKNIFTAIQMLSSVRQRPNLRIDDTPLYEEAFRGLDINPETIIRSEEDLDPQNVLNFLLQNRQNAANARQELGGDVVEGAPPVEDTIPTPVGDVGATP